MKRAELPRRINGALTEKGLTANFASREATGGPDFIRDLKRFPHSKVDVGKLGALARVLSLPVAYLVDEAVTAQGELMTKTRNQDAEIWRLANEITENALSDRRSPKHEEHRREVAALVYEVIAEHVAEGAAVDDPVMLKIVAGVVRRLVLRKHLK